MQAGEVVGRVSELKIDRSPQRARRRRGRKVLAASVVALAIVAAVVWSLSRPPVVSVAQVREARPGEATTSLSAAGYVAAQRRSVVAPKVPGRLEEVLVNEGDQVAQGDVIARLDSDDATVGLEQARAAVAAADAQLAAARAQAVKARRDVERTRRLAAGGAVTNDTLQDAIAARNAATANQRAAAARVDEARRAVDAAQLQVEHTTIRAPFTGTIVKKLADEGAVLAPAAISEENFGGIVEMVDLGSLEVEAEVSEDQLSRIKEGQPALVFLDAWPDRVLQARAGTVRPAIDRAKATAVVKVQFLEPPEGALPDMSAKVSFLEKPLPREALEKEARLRVPASAVVDRDGRKVVFVVEEGRAEATPVQIDRRVGNEVSLARGPKPGTPIVTAPNGRLQDGKRVRVEAQAS